MDYDKNDISERMKKIRQESLDEQNPALDRAKNSPYFIDRPNAPKASVESALPMDEVKDKQAEQNASMTLSKPKQEESKTQENADYYGHKMTDEQQDIVKGLMQNLPKGKVMTNIESMRMKFKQ